MRLSKGHPYGEFLTLLVITLPILVLLPINFLYFHILVEAYTVAIGVTIFVISFNARHYLTNSLFPILGIAFLSVASVDFIHSLAYKGMGLVGISSANTATQLWILGRYLHALSILGAFMLFHRPINLLSLSFFYGAITLSGIGLVLTGHFPDCYIEGVGLTRFKIISEFIVMALFGTALWFSGRLKSVIDAYTLKMFQFGLVAAIGAEVMFSLYIDVYSIVNATGHIFKMASFYFFYRACVYMSINKPYESIFKRLTEQKEFLASVIESLAHPFYVVDAQSYKVKMANSAAGLKEGSTITCYSARHGKGSPCHLLGDTCPIEEVKRTKGPVKVEHIYTDAQGQRMIEEVHAYPIFSPYGEVREVIAYCFDVTQKRKQQELLKKLSLAIEQSSDSILITDSEGTIEYVNSTFCKVTGYSPQEVIGKSPNIFKSGVTPQEVYAVLWKTIKAGKTWQGEICNRKKDGTLFWESMKISPLTDPDGRITHFVAVREDIQDRIRAQVAEEKVRETERRLVELEQDMKILDKLMRLHQPTLAMRAYGQIPLVEAAPEFFETFVREYGELLDRYIEVQIYKVDYDIVSSLKDFADRLGMNNLGPRDLIDIHTTALKTKSFGQKKEGLRAYHEEGKIMLLELMGYLVNYYRNYFITTSKKSH
jgi:PAS domain S-box-containing protein